MKYRRGLWPVIAEFAYKDDKINYSAPIRVRKFKFKAKVCETHGRFHERLHELKDFIECPYCKKLLLEKEVFMFCAYIVNSEDFIDVAAILNRYTVLRWQKTGFKFRQKPSVVAYSQSLDGIAKGIGYAIEFNIKQKGEVSVKMLDVTEQMLDDFFKKSENNRLLREI